MRKSAVGKIGFQAFAVQKWGRKDLTRERGDHARVHGYIKKG
ncbi:hypothetical protein [Desulfobacter latus]|nr:hypothetical protein [Desulfobacter latus]